MTSMNLVRSMWWRVCDDGRFLVRWLAARHPRLALSGVAGRWVLHLLVGNIGHVALVVVALVLPLPWQVRAGVVVLPCLLFEVWYQAVWYTGAGSWWHGWRGWWRVRRSIPAEWDEAAAKSPHVQTAYGGERRSSGRLRSIADHPKTSWRPRIEWPVVSVHVGHPPGRTAAAAVEFQQTIAANILRVDDVAFDFARGRDSIGTLRITFVDVLSRPVVPEPSTPGPDVAPAERAPQTVKDATDDRAVV